MRFRLLAGIHVERAEVGKDKDGKPVWGDVLYHAGDVFDSPTDLRKLNGKGMSPKFELLNAGEAELVPQAPAPNDPRYFQSVEEQQRDAEEAPIGVATEPQDFRNVPRPPAPVLPAGQQPVVPEQQMVRQPQTQQPSQPVPSPQHQPTDKTQGQPGPDTSRAQPHPQTPGQSQQPPHPPNVSQQTKAQQKAREKYKGRADEIKALQGMTVDELKKYADEEEIDLHGAKTKDEIVKTIADAEAEED